MDGGCPGDGVFEPIRAGRWVRALRGAGLLNREFTIAQATVFLMGSFLFSAALGAVRQVLFNAEFGVGQEANAYYAAFRLPDLLFSLVAGGALSSAMIPVLASAASEESEAAEQRVASLVMGGLLPASHPSIVVMCPVHRVGWERRCTVRGCPVICGLLEGVGETDQASFAKRRSGKSHAVWCGFCVETRGKRNRWI